MPLRATTSGASRTMCWPLLACAAAGQQSVALRLHGGIVVDAVLRPASRTAGASATLGERTHSGRPPRDERAAHRHSAGRNIMHGIHLGATSGLDDGAGVGVEGFRGSSAGLRLNKMSNASVDLPEPLTPVTLNLPRGMSTLRCCRLCSRALMMRMCSLCSVSWCF